MSSVLLTILAIVASHAAQEQPLTVASAAKAEKPALPPSVSQYFAGRWNGSGTFVRSGRPVESSFEFEPRPDSESMAVRHAEKAPNSFAYDGILTVDSIRGDLLMLMASNNKGGGRLFRSAGWQNDILVFQSVPELRTAFALERITFVRQNAGSFKAIYEMSRDGVTWSVGDEQIFVKS
jgi:hypothetical protein